MYEHDGSEFVVVEGAKLEGGPMSRYETITVERAGPIATLMLNRPHAANALNRTLLRESVEALDSFANEPTLRVVIITGTGTRHFSGGADLRDIVSATEAYERFIPARAIWDVVEALPVPVIAAMNGTAMGGGLELALASDIRILSDAAKVGLPEVLFGALPAGGGTARLPRIIGLGRAKEMIMLGRTIDAATALSYGIVHEVVPQPDVLSRANEIAAEFARLAPFAVRSAKLLLTEGPNMDRHTALQFERVVIANMATGDEQTAARDEAAAASETYGRLFDKGGRSVRKS